MKKRIIAVAAAVLLIAAVLSSCNAVPLIATVDSLLTPPLYYSEYEGLVSAFNSSVESSVVLCNPTEGDHLSAITVSDVDSDEAEEGIVFFRDTLEENTAHLSLFKNTDDTWKKMCDFKGYGNEVRSLTLTDLDGDGIEELIVIWSYSGIDGGNVVAVYKAADKSLAYEEILFESCEIARPVDFNGNGREEIFFITSSKGENAVTKTAKLFGYSGDSLTEIGSTPVDPSAISYASFKTEKAVEQAPLKVYVDAVKSNNMMITEVFYWDEESGELQDPLYDAQVGANTATLRFEQLQCADVNNDGQIEIPVQSVYSEPRGEDDVTMYLTEWTYFDYDKPVFSESTFVNVDDGYLVNLGILGKEKLYIRKHTGGDWASWSVYTDSKSSVSGNVLFTIIKVPKERWQNDMVGSSSYITILKQLDSVVCVNINEKGKAAGLDEAKIKKIVTRLPS